MKRMFKPILLIMTFVFSLTTVYAQTKFKNTATISSDQTDPIPGNNSSDVTPTPKPITTFTYLTSLCSNGANPSPTMSTDGVKGIFSSSPSGIGFVSTSTGELDMSNSTPGSYTITNSVVATTDYAANSASFNIVIFPAAPSITAPANTCSSAFTLPIVASVSGFTVEYSIDGGAFAATPTVPTTTGCHTVSTRYVLTSAWAGLSAGTTAPAGCTTSNTVSVVIFPAAPTITAPANTCSSAFTLPSVASVSGFTIEYSIDGGTFAASPTIPTSVGCHTVSARYVLTSLCGGNAAGASAPAGCAASNQVSVVIFPAAPSISAPANTCGGTAFTLPTVAAVSGFTVEYKIGAGSYTANPTVPTSPNTYTVSARYVLGTACGSNAIGTASPSGCESSVSVTIDALPTISSQPSASDQNNLCYNSASTALSVTAAAGSGSISKYEWFSNTTNSTSGGTSVAIHTTSLTTTDSYTPLTSTVGGLYYYVVVTNSNGCTVTSSVSGKVTVIACSDLQITKTVDDPTPLVGQNIIFTLTVYNDGPSDATNVKVHDLLSATGYTYVSDDSASSSTTYNNTSGDWIIGNLASKATIKLKITATVKP